MTRLFIDVHILQTVPPSNVNRDDTGSPKTAVYGGVRRGRVSSQAWKRATRTEFRSLVDPASLGVRTKRVVELIAERIGEIDHDSEELREPDNRVAAAVQVLKGAGIVLEKPKKKKDEVIDPVEQSKYLLFLSANQIDRLAHLAIAAAKGATLDKSAAKAAANGADSIDVALFGRMVADSTDLNVDAAAQVAHAISVHGVNNEFDYYTAVDDRSPEDNAGAGMIGVVEFNSSTLYRYATVDLGMLEKNLGSAEATVLAVEAFAKAFVRSMPSGKQNTFAHRTLPDAVVFSLREDQPVNLVTAFEEPVNAVGAARSVAAAKALVTRYSAIESSFGDGATRNFVVATGEGADTLSAIAEPVSFAEAVEGVVDTVRAALGVSS
ncbi:type I-E CRISPR-associated protein Cas7/Cse4/CasC [Nocardia farcinica]|uniref:type I-E CRISPR-associated protein Cas7/Cse4/CasC n=1 Tax=Nocardia farcinica TaxID=37329 RepID=UPI001893BEBE|nr:type I-E CRISPR-associated protein Cas7/Cse4/CasC [Nocardia farcinica]MBF6141321.1 type I-E CRISPR-associated protein Cas7/Cse4/CasC [Nocardia farcinica]MBF6260124.1 type I-E CRISPR-associated protein Cas7/Cse4/CasC [Nocardia farcinica]MBF6535924.1 type I-E CRISPR-associated protein Cas7/Cse4/CasC [Nocardia farcinica]